MITPYEFTERMRRITLNPNSDTEDMHEEMDHLMCQTLRLLGYGDGVNIFESTERWYS